MRKLITQITSKCSECGKVIVADYALDGDGNLICYACCAIQDHEYMLEHGVIDLYLTKRCEG